VKKCPQCGREYSGGITVCPIDNQELVSFFPPIEPLTTREQAEPSVTPAPHWELSRDERYRHLAIAWGIAFVVFAINHQRDLLAAILYFPLPAYILLDLGGLPSGPVSAAGLGWIVYVSLSWLLLLVRKRFVYFGLYLVLCLLLLLNVIA
jgi:hypothetical protein